MFAVVIIIIFIISLRLLVKNFFLRIPCFLINFFGFLWFLYFTLEAFLTSLIVFGGPLLI